MEKSIAGSGEREKRLCSFSLNPLFSTSSRVVASTLQLFGPACLVYLLSDVRPTVELGDSLNQEGVFNPFLV